VAVARVARVVLRGGVVAYPTEGVYGIGCAAGNGDAARRVLALKGRAARHGLIVIAAGMEQLEPWIAPLAGVMRRRLDATWPGPVTWVVAARPDAPAWLTGGRDTIAVRVTAHPLASALCVAAGTALVSTSANRHGRPPARDAMAVRRAFGARIDDILSGPCGDLTGPTEIRDLASGRVLRPAPEPADG
jgi:L-threonylcarbamoyladenylate synthase